MVSNYWCEVWLSSMLYLPLFIFFLQDVDEWNQIFVVRSSKIASVIYVYMINLFFLTKHLCIIGFSFVKMHSSIFFWMVFFDWSYCWQVAIFVVLAMTLRRKPEVLINIMPKIMGSNKYLGQEKLPIIVWVIAQVFFCLVPVMLVTYTALFFSIL